MQKEFEPFIKLPENPGAAVNIDDANLENYKKSRLQRLEMQKKIDQINTVKQDVDELKFDINDIKNLLQQLLEKK